MYVFKFFSLFIRWRTNSSPTQRLCYITSVFFFSQHGDVVYTAATDLLLLTDFAASFLSLVRKFTAFTQFMSKNLRKIKEKVSLRRVILRMFLHMCYVTFVSFLGPAFAKQVLRTAQ